MPRKNIASRIYRRNLPHIQEEGETFFVTFCTKDGRVLDPEARSVVLDCCRYVHDRTAVLHGVVVMPDRVHLILTPLSDENGQTWRLERILQGIKGVSARRINLLLRREGPLWLGESFDHMLRTDESAEAKVEYIAHNAVRKGLAKTPEEYPWLRRLSEQHG
jgi:REP element-mobilizing transposase RayT